MKHYPSIQKEPIRGINIFAFSKYDGSNIRAEWSRKRGFYKFGTKTQMLDASHPVFGEAVDLIGSSYSENLSKIFVDGRYENTVCFFEFFGPNSFAGHHEVEDHRVVLTDVSVLRKGFMGPGEFIDTFW